MRDFRYGFEIKMNFDRNVSCFVTVYGFMDNDFFHQAVQGGSVQLGDVPVFLYGFHSLPCVHGKPDFIGKAFPAFLNYAL